MASAPEQLVFDLPHRAAFEAEDFLVSDSNRAAVEIIDRWPDWPHAALIVTGPAGAGKSHLGNVWRLRSGATLIHASQADDVAIAAHPVAKGAVIEDADRGIKSEQALFHLLNMAREHKFNVLLTARTQPGEWSVTMPDLRSRLRSAALVVIEPPDDALLRSVLVKLFSDRQISVEPRILEHMSVHMERSMEAAVALVEEIDRRSLQAQRKVTRALVSEVLAGWRRE
jgi:chromosomal replication initiation ATPase DnaA